MQKIEIIVSDKDFETIYDMVDGLLSDCGYSFTLTDSKL